MEQTIMLYSLNLNWQVQAEIVTETADAAMIDEADDRMNKREENAVTTEEAAEGAAGKEYPEIAEKDLQTELYALMPELKESVNRILGDVIDKTDITGFQNDSHTAILSVEWEPAVDVEGSSRISQVIRETTESFLKEHLGERFDCGFQVESSELGIFTRKGQQDEAASDIHANPDYERGRYDAEVENMLEKVMEQNKDLERMIVRNQEKSKKNGFVKYLLVVNIVQSSILFGLLLFIFIRLFMVLG